MASAAIAVSGCGSYGRALTHREIVVVFVPDRTHADVERVSAKCDGVAGATAILARADSAANQRYPLRFDVTKLDTRGRSKLEACLSSDRSVRGYVDSDSTSG